MLQSSTTPLSLASLPDLVLDEIPPLLQYSDPKALLALTLTCSSLFARIARDFHLWHRVYFGAIESIDPEIHKIVWTWDYTDYSREVGSGRLVRNVWFRCAVIALMQGRCQVFYIHWPEDAKGMENGGITQDCARWSADGEALPPALDTPWTRQVWDHDEWLVDAGEFSIVDQFEKYANNKGRTTLKWVPRHDIAFFGWADEIRKFSVVNKLISDPAYDVPEGVPKLGHRVRFGDVITTAAGLRGLGKFFVLPSTVLPDDRWDGLLPSDASRPRFVAVQSPAHEERAAVPKCCAPPTFPFSYYNDVRWDYLIEVTHMKDGTFVSHDPNDDYEWGHQFETADEREARHMGIFGW
ncbi:hypothetical protein HK104_005811 [Borealophlyctis nickersoniae]|nr:hypothetical protein HK104_005811 [Borealophlyctis nickersoniae]